MSDIRDFKDLIIWQKGCDDYTKEQKTKLSNVTREEFWQDIQRIRERKKDRRN